MKIKVCSFILEIAALGGFFHAVAQTNAGLNGTVTDASGAVVQGAKVSVTSRDTGLRRETATNESGQYEFPLLQPGTYSLTAQNVFNHPVLADPDTNVTDGSFGQINSTRHPGYLAPAYGRVVQMSLHYQF